MPLLLKNARLFDPSIKLDCQGSIIIEKEIITYVIKKGVDLPDIAEHIPSDKQFDLNGALIVPGFIDMHTHLREPGEEHKETIKTGTHAAVAGGFTSVACMPNTIPVNDCATVTGYILSQAEKYGFCEVFPIAAITSNLEGKSLTEFGELKEAGAVAFSDDGRPVENPQMMRRGLEYSKLFDIPLISHCEDTKLASNGVMHEGWVSTKLGLSGIPCAAETVMVLRDISLARLTGARLHIAHVSSAESVEAIRRAKDDGLNVTAETAPHYFTLTHEAVEGYNTNAKMNPPLRTFKDMQAIIKGLSDGTIDAIATDHAPHHTDNKQLEFARAANGITGLETAVSLALKCLHNSEISLERLVDAMSLKPAKILNLPKCSIKTGLKANLTVIDLESKFTVNQLEFKSKSKNTPFIGMELKGRPIMTIVRGNPVWILNKNNNLL